MEEKDLPFKPIFARVLLHREKKEKIGSILLPETSKERHAQARGTVLAVGETCDDAVKELLGKEVLFAKFSGDWIKINNEEFFICQDEDILGEITVRMQ